MDEAHDGTAALFDARLGRDGFLPAFHIAFLAAAAVCAVALLLALLPMVVAREPDRRATG